MSDQLERSIKQAVIDAIRNVLTPSFIPELQKQAIKLKGDIEALKTLRHSVANFPGITEHEACNQMTAIREMQFASCLKALQF